MTKLRVAELTLNLWLFFFSSVIFNSWGNKTFEDEREETGPNDVGASVKDKSVFNLSLEKEWTQKVVLSSVNFGGKGFF